MADTMIVFDLSGGLKLLIGAAHEQMTVMVSPQALCLASPVWRAMLNPASGFQEATSVERTVSFPEDDPETFIILLQICHLNFSKVPEVLTYRELTKIAVLCDKYDTVALVRPWISKWQQKHILLAEKDGFEEWLLISWTFGNRAVFESVFTKLVQETTSCEGGKLVTSAGKIVEIDMPPGIIDAILSTRQALLDNLLELSYNLIDKFKLSNCAFPPERDDCNTVVLGSRTLALTKANLWPKRLTSSDITISVKDLEKQLLNFRFKSHLCPIYTHMHACCHGTELFHVMVSYVLHSERTKALEDYRMHLDTQAEK